MSARPAPRPAAILRGHCSQIHAAAFVADFAVPPTTAVSPRSSSPRARLLTGDADGFVVSWDVATRRPRAVWQAHARSVVGVRAWGRDKVLTQGRDGELLVWRLDAAAEARLSTALPVEPVAGERPRPWLLHLLRVETVGFCAFTACEWPADDRDDEAGLLVAVPGGPDFNTCHIYHLPSQRQVYKITIATPQHGPGRGMMMSLALLQLPPTVTDARGQARSRLRLVTGFEDGSTTVSRFGQGEDGAGEGEIVYAAWAHSQPVLSVAVAAEGEEYFYSSGADAVVAKHPMVGPGLPVRVAKTRHAGQQGLSIRSDGRLLATAGWDGRVRVYSARTLEELAVLQWHEAGCYAACFAPVRIEGLNQTSNGDKVTDEATVRARDGERGGEVAGEGGGQGVGQGGKEEIQGQTLDLVSLRGKRVSRALEVHWVAAGSKDGKVSLWEVY